MIFEFGEERRYELSDYHLQAPFSSFLPGIAGPDGTPLWCFYVNRGQGVAGFGHTDKNHPILEFKPADQAYRDTARMGFRTFLRLNGELREAFAAVPNGPSPARRLSVGRSGFHIIENDGRLRVKVDYATVPGESYPGLLRHLEIRNISRQPISLELLDGLPRVTPFGINDAALKTMSSTAAAWIETELTTPGVPVFRIRASMDDTVEVGPVDGYHFMAAVAHTAGEDKVLQPLVDAAMIFGGDLAFDSPRRFLDGGLKAVMAENPVLMGRYPAAFTGLEETLQPGEKVSLYTIYGYAANSQNMDDARRDWRLSQWFENKFCEYRKRVDECISPFMMSTAMANLDAYTAQTALDNTLRGGMPVVWGEGDSARTYHLYSRKHGDMERDYNDFSLTPTRYSSGFGNYRDMNQNRRIDVAVQPKVDTSIIRQFMDLIQPDGYNPLIVKVGGFRLCGKARDNILNRFPNLALPEDGIFTPGDLANAYIAPKDFPVILGAAEYMPDAHFGEGYWVDHWTYNLDLIDQYLRIYPDRKEALLFASADYRWYVSPGIRIRSMSERFRSAKEGIIAESHLIEEHGDSYFLEYRSTLAEKLITLALVKCSVLGYEERGLEMEAGRPGWYDALNGLPGHFGSSLSDGVELLRLIRMILSFTENSRERTVTLFGAAWTLLDDLRSIAGLRDRHERWLAREKARVTYRTALAGGEPMVEERAVGGGGVIDFLIGEERRLGGALTAAAADNDGLLPTYYRFETESWTVPQNGYVLPSRLVRKDLPLFLEGMVKQMKISSSATEKLAVHEAVKKSPLYDSELGLYVLNAPLDGQPATLGRANAFPCGWLENGSVWLHMEYKYLLELLRTGDGELFWSEAMRILIPFLDSKRYGRSPYENSSFIASSRYPVKSCHGRGFVGRLSGATAEYLTMWSEFLIGQQPIVMEEGKPVFRPAPLLPAALFRQDDSLEFVLFGATHTRYENPDRINLFADSCRIDSMCVWDGCEREYIDHLPAPEVNKLRKGEIKRLRVVFKPVAPQ
ncbi:MAG: hypothetical protein B6D68_01275 [spirochete symbiont of Stewartia floridana]|nr:MAG: hypothetical protein B6D68_01275 [spirochete symbiont of Stewartia floridana]